MIDMCSILLTDFVKVHMDKSHFVGMILLDIHKAFEYLKSTHPSNAVWSEQLLSRFNRNSSLHFIRLHSFSKRKKNYNYEWHNCL